MVKLNRIYTRTGDDSTTGLVDGARVPKHGPRIEAVGAVDEANAALGYASCAIDDDLADEIGRLMNDMFDLGADLATPGEDFSPSDMHLRIVPSQVSWLEARIDAHNAALAPLSSFILPGGNEAAARLHLARTAARRAERAISALAASEPVNPQACAFINRLSDYLFVVSRRANEDGARDMLWTPGANR